jgi:hypothetical protein
LRIHLSNFHIFFCRKKKQRKLQKFLAISANEKKLLLTVAGLLLMVRISLVFLPFRTVLKRIESVSPGKRLEGVPPELVCARVSWAVRVVRKYMPFAKCLPQAMVVKLLLARQACPGQLRIGVYKRENGALEAHAWVESKGRIIIGELSDISRYNRLPAITGKVLRKL